MKTTEEKSIGDRIVDGFKHAITEMEEFRVQLALGKAETRDLYEDSKKKFNAYLHEAKLKEEKVRDTITGEAAKLRTFYEELQLQLALGKAETKETFEVQRKNILNAVNKVETFIRQSKTLNTYYSHLLIELDKFKIKLEILKLRYELKKLEVQEDFEARKKAFLQYLEEAREKSLFNPKHTSYRFTHMQEELSKAHAHFRKVFA